MGVVLRRRRGESRDGWGSGLSEDDVRVAFVVEDDGLLNLFFNHAVRLVVSAVGAVALDLLHRGELIRREHKSSRGGAILRAG